MLRKVNFRPAANAGAHCALGSRPVPVTFVNCLSVSLAIMVGVFPAK